MNSNDEGKKVSTPHGIGILQGVAELICGGQPTGQEFATVLINGRRMIYEVDQISLHEPVVVHFERVPDEKLL